MIKVKCMVFFMDRWNTTLVVPIEIVLAGLDICKPVSSWFRNPWSSFVNNALFAWAIHSRLGNCVLCCSKRNCSYTTASFSCIGVIILYCFILICIHSFLALIKWSIWKTVASSYLNIEHVCKYIYIVQIYTFSNIDNAM